MTKLPVRINTPAGPVEVMLEAEQGAVHVSTLVPQAHALTDAMMKASVDFVEQRGFPVSCRVGCAACCRHLVAVTPLEAFILADAVNALSPDIQEGVKARAAAVIERLEASGLAGKIRSGLVGEEGKAVVKAYFKEQLACPLLVDEVCSVYEARPTGCRQLGVVSDPSHCEEPGSTQVQRLPVFVDVQRALTRVSSSLFPEHPSQIPLPLAIAWTEKHPELKTVGARGVELLKGLLQSIG